MDNYFDKPILINSFKFTNEIPFERTYSTEINKSFPVSYSRSSLINVSSTNKIFQKRMETFFVKIDKMFGMMFFNFVRSSRERKVSKKFVLNLIFYEIIPIGNMLPCRGRLIKVVQEDDEQK